jgi:hypothetical protein
MGVVGAVGVAAVAQKDENASDSLAVPPIATTGLLRAICAPSTLKPAPGAPAKLAVIDRAVLAKPSLNLG